MFVRKSKYDETLQELIDSRKETLEAFAKLTRATNLYHQLQSDWNDIIGQINDKGGRAFLEFGRLDVYSTATPKQFTDDDLRSLLQLVHPDKHGGKESAHRLTQKINGLRG